MSGSRIVRNRAACCLLILVAAPVQAATAQDPGAQELLDKVDPRADDWRPEALAATASDRLGALLSALLRGEGVDPAMLPATARASRLTSTGPPAETPPGMPAVTAAGQRHVLTTIRTEAAASAPLDAGQALRQWAAAVGGADARVTAKLLSADLRGTEFITRARIETFGRSASDRYLQHTALWRLQWLISADGQPRLQEIRGLQAQEASSPRLWFEDMTSALAARTARSTPRRPVLAGPHRSRR